MDYIKAGRVVHFFDKIQVAVIEASDEEIKVGDNIRFGDNGVEMTVESLQVDHKPVEKIALGQEAAMKVDAAVKSHDTVYKQA